ncbi:SAM hydrolase/SAM-dependent halogenase family protein [Desulfonatronum parangueonense]
MDSRQKHASLIKPVIALLTDFGLDDTYVGQMKGVLAGLTPEAVVVDVSHQVRPFDILQGAFYLAASWPHFPEGTIFVGVVDPGVGTARRLVMIRRNGRMLLCPDNGLAALLLDGGDGIQAWEFALGGNLQAGREVSNTFHGRDVLMPLAAELARGGRPEDLGAALDPADLVRPEWARADRDGREIQAHVLHVDRFGNCLLNLALEKWPAELLAGVELLRPLLQPLTLVRTYGELGQGSFGILAGSQGYWELAVNQGSAAQLLGLGPRTRIVFRTS